MKTKKNKLNDITYFLFSFPCTIIYCIFFISPVFLGIYYSFTDWNGISKQYNFIGLKNFIKLFNSGRFSRTIIFNLKYSIYLIIGIIIISLFIAILLNSKIKQKVFFKAIYFFPAVLSMITVGLIWNEIFYRFIPFIGQQFGIEFLSKNILSNPKYAMFGVLIVNIWQGVAIPIVLFLAGLQSIPSVLYEAATIDGATSIQKFKNITFPYIIPVINVVFVLALKAGFTVFEYIMALTGGGPGGATESIGILIYKHAFDEFKYSYSIAESVILFVLIGGISLIQIGILSKREVN